MPALTALACPTVNSYRRRQAEPPIAPFAAWGYDNRETLLRVAPQNWREVTSSANIEVKLADGASNPYLMMGGLIAAILDGQSNRYPLAAPIERSPALIDAETRQTLGLQPLPSSLITACDTLEHDAILSAALGSPMLDAFLAVKRKEARTFENATTASEIARHFWKF